MLKTNRKSLALTPMIAAATLALVGCSAESTGQPTSAAPDSSGGVSSSSPGQAGASQLSAMKACDLLTNQELAVMQVQGNGRDQDTAASGATSGCHWSGTAANGAATTLGVSVRAAQGVDSVNANGGQVTHGTVNSRPAVQVVENPSATCMISLAVSPSARVDLTFVVVGASDATEACETDNKIANIVEPKLPKYEG